MRVFKLNLMIQRQVSITYLSDNVVRRPAIRHDGRPWGDVLLNDGQQGGGILGGHGDQEAQFLPFLPAVPSIPPNTRCRRPGLPTSALRRTNRASTTSTFTPTPPITAALASKCSPQMSLQKLCQLTTVGSQMSHSFANICTVAILKTHR